MNHLGSFQFPTCNVLLLSSLTKSSSFTSFWESTTRMTKDTLLLSHSYLASVLRFPELCLIHNFAFSCSKQAQRSFNVCTSFDNFKQLSFSFIRFSSSSWACSSTIWYKHKHNIEKNIKYEIQNIMWCKIQKGLHCENYPLIWSIIIKPCTK